MRNVTEKELKNRKEVHLGDVYIEEYSFNKNNSSPPEPQTRLDPGYPGELAIDIGLVYVENQISTLKKLKVGDRITFKINQTLLITVPNYKNKEDDDIEYYANGIGSGTILSEMEEIDSELSDDEIIEIEIRISDGYAEGL